MKKIFQSWTIFEILLLIMSTLLIIITGVFGQSEILTILVALFGVFCALMQAKGKVLSQFIGLILVVLYSIVSFKNKYYGEVIIYITVMLPLYISGIISWTKNSNKETKTVNKNEIHKKEWIYLIFINIYFFIIFKFLFLILF